LRAFQCWAFSKHPSKIPQIVYLTLAHHIESLIEAHVQFVRPRGVKHAHVYKIFIHIDVVEYLLFYHYPRDELTTNGKVHLRDLPWQYGCPNGDLAVVDDFLPVPRRCGADETRCREPRDDDDR
jgi:hypothetical protein